MTKPLNKQLMERIEGLESLRASAVLKGEHKLAERYEDTVLVIKDDLSALKTAVEEIEKKKLKGACLVSYGGSTENTDWIRVSDALKILWKEDK